MSLKGLSVLVTRPDGQADGLITAIQQAGGTAYHIPVLAITPLDPQCEKGLVQACKQQIMDLDHFQQVIFVSTNAVRYGMEWIESYWPQLPTGIIWHAIGRSTAAKLRATGVDVALNDVNGDVALNDHVALSGYAADHASTQNAPPTNSLDNKAGGRESAMNSEALLQHPAFKTVEGQKILIVRGVDGREHLNTQLTQRGARVSYAQCYHRELPVTRASDLQQLLKQPLDAICVNSADSLGNLCLLAGDEQLATLQSKVLLLPSKRVQNAASKRGFNNSYVVQNASDKAMMAGLLSVVSAQK